MLNWEYAGTGGVAERVACCVCDISGCAAVAAGQPFASGRGHGGVCSVFHAERVVSVSSAPFAAPGGIAPTARLWTLFEHRGPFQKEIDTTDSFQWNIVAYICLLRCEHWVDAERHGPKHGFNQRREH